MPLFDSASNKGTPFLEMDFNVIESELSSTFKKQVYDSYMDYFGCNSSLCSNF